LSGAFSFFAGHFRARRRREIYNSASKIGCLFVKGIFTYPPMRVNACPAREIAVHKMVDNVGRKICFELLIGSGKKRAA